jgi:predicted permease
VSDVTGAVWRCLLRLAPRSLRVRHGAEMEAMFREALDDARPQGVAAMARVWLRSSADLLWSRARFQPRRRTAGLAPSPERQASMFGSDIRYALRALGRQKGATLLVLSMLALGIAANVAVFTLINGLFLRPFPFPQSERLVYINEAAPRWNLEYVGINYPDFVQWRNAQRAFEAIAWYDTTSFNLSDGAGAERITGAQVTYDYAAVLGVRPLVGRMFTPEEDRPNAAPVVVLGERLWRERFGADPRIVGRTLRLMSMPYTVVGVMPRATEVADGARLWVPRRGDPNQPYQSYGGTGMGRLKAGVTIEAAEQDLKRAQQPIWDARDKERIVSPFVRDLRTELVRDYATASFALVVAVALLLLVACANVASLMLARALARRREMGIRVAIGASRLRLVRQLFIENGVLALVGGAIGLLLGRWAIALLVAAVPDEAPQWTEFALDARVAAFAIAASALTTLLFGWAPALQAFRGTVQSAVHDITKGTTTSPRGQRTLQILVAAECGLAALLLVCGGLLLRAYDRVRHVDPGFRTEGVLTFGLLLPEATYPDNPKRLAFWDRLEGRLRALPGVERAALITCPPLGCHWGTFFDAEGAGVRARDDADPVVLQRFASASYLETMGVTLKQGRFFDDRDGRNRIDGNGGVRPIVVNETFVRTFWPGVSNPIGRRVKNRGNNPWLTVVGVTADVKHYGLERPMRPGVYRPLPENPADNLTVALYTRGDPETLAPSARAIVRALDPDLPIFRVRTMEQAMSTSMRIRTVYSWMLGVFAALALVLALGGAYGVSAYLVTQRRRELAIRVALGARAADIFRSVLARSLAVVTVGVVAGLGGSLFAARLLSTLLFGVAPHDLLVLGSAAGALVATALAANYWPARRASRVDPISLLRTE